MKYITTTLIAAFCWMNAIDAADYTTPAQELEAKLKQLTSFEANFIQQRYSSSRGIQESTSGRFILQRPNRFLWQTFEPYAQTILSDGKVIWTIDVDLEQVIINSVDEEIQNAPILLLAQEQGDLAKQFVIEKNIIEGKDFFILMPIDSSGNFEKLTIGFQDETLSVFELFDSLGQVTRISMTNARNNPVLDVVQFTPEIPEDYDVIDSRPVSDD